MRLVHLSAEETSFIRQLARVVVDNLGKEAETQTQLPKQSPSTTQDDSSQSPQVDNSPGTPSNLGIRSLQEQRKRRLRRRRSRRQLHRLQHVQQRLRTEPDGNRLHSPVRSMAVRQSRKQSIEVEQCRRRSPARPAGIRLTVRHPAYM